MGAAVWAEERGGCPAQVHRGRCDDRARVVNSQFFQRLPSSQSSLSPDLSRVAPFSTLIMDTVVPGLPRQLALPGSCQWEALVGDGGGEEGRSQASSNSASLPWTMPPAAEISLQGSQLLRGPLCLQLSLGDSNSFLVPSVCPPAPPHPHHCFLLSLQPRRETISNPIPWESSGAQIMAQN